MSQSPAGEGSRSLNNPNIDSFNTNSFNNTNSLNHTIANTVTNTIPFSHVPNANLGSSDEKGEILEWLSPLDPWIRHHDVRAKRVEYVEDWLLRTEEYRSWFDGISSGESDNSALFCYGDSEVGKTYITSLVIDSLCDWAMRRNAVVACFYFDFAAQKQQSPTTVLSSILKQLVGGLENIPRKIVEVFQDQKKPTGGRRLELSQVVEMLQDITSSRPTFICFDALDECVPEYRGKLLDLLDQILHESPSARIFLAGRLHVRDEVENRLAGKVEAVSITPTKDNIIRFRRVKLEEDTMPDTMDSGLEEDIIRNIPETVSELFLLVSPNTEAILRETMSHRRREKLDSMKNGLGMGDAYDPIIIRIKAQGGDRARLGMETLMWISHSERPLDVNEICHALAVEIGFTNLNPHNVPTIRTILACCQGLVAVDKGSSTVRLIHFTLKEYLSRHADLFYRPHSKIAETCLTYLNFQTIKDLSASPSRYSGDSTLLQYASLHWGTHMRMEYSDRARKLALDLAQCDNHISTELLWKSVSEWYFDLSKPFSALHCASYFGIAEVAIDLIRTKRWDANERDTVGRTPLMWAASYGREEVVKVLLEQKHTKPDLQGGLCGRTALSWAAGSGHEGVVRLFLSRPLTNPGSIGCLRGTQQAMSVLFGRKYVHPDKPDYYGQTPLSWAARDGSEGVVKLLLEREYVSPDKPDKYGQTPLSFAARYGSEGVVKLLLEREDVSPDKPNIDGQTPLSLAAKNGSEGVVKLLLEREDVCPDKPDKYGQTPLYFAAGYGSERVVKLLLEREDVYPDKPDNDGQTPLSLAAKNGSEGVVKLLLEREDVSPDKPDNDGRTPLSRAAENGSERVVKLLLGREDVSPDKPDNGGQTPLSWAAKYGRGGEVKLLLEREGVSPDKPDNRGQTPLSFAAENGREGVVELLLSRQDVSPHKPDNRGRTPLSLATNHRHKGVVNLLKARMAGTPRAL